MQSKYLLCQGRISFCVLEVCGNCGSVDVRVCTCIYCSKSYELLIVVKCHTILNEISQPSRKIVVTFVNVLNDI